MELKEKDAINFSLLKGFYLILILLCIYMIKCSLLFICSESLIPRLEAPDCCTHSESPTLSTNLGPLARGAAEGAAINQQDRTINMNAVVCHVAENVDSHQKDDVTVVCEKTSVHPQTDAGKMTSTYVQTDTDETSTCGVRHSQTESSSSSDSDIGGGGWEQTSQPSATENRDDDGDGSKVLDSGYRRRPSFIPGYAKPFPRVTIV
jgi:hypothetical protein